MNELLQSWEEKVGGVRHEANLKNFQKLFGALNWIKGAAWAFGFILTGLEIYRIASGK